MRRKIITMLMIICGLAVSSPVFAVKSLLSDFDNQKQKEDLDFEMYAKTYVGGMFNYLSYDVTSPTAGLSAWFKMNFHKDEPKYQYITYKIDGEYMFSNVTQSNYALHKIYNNLKARFGERQGQKHTGINLEYKWMIKPSWPDLYQPNPLNYNAAFNMNDVLYDPTDRYSYHLLAAEYTYAIPFKGDRSLYWSVGLEKKFGYDDPNFDPAVPTRLSSGSYTGLFGKIGLKDTGNKRSIYTEISNELAIDIYDTELARDAVTGKTHYATNPNPKYFEIHDELTYELTLPVPSASFEFSPYVTGIINLDTFQGYYTYFAPEIGFEIRQNILDKKLEYKLGASVKYLMYTDAGYNTSANHPALKDGNTLYKLYFDANAELSYHFNRNFEMFLEGSFTMKRTNFPDYVPGVNPATGRNYSIDFSYDNYEVKSGVVYHL